jgi:hypothetical protein
MLDAHRLARKMWTLKSKFLVIGDVAKAAKDQEEKSKKRKEQGRQLKRQIKHLRDFKNQVVSQSQAT